MPDGDLIVLTKNCSKPLPADQVRIGLVSNYDWWKGINVFDQGSFKKVLVQVSDNPGTPMVTGKESNLLPLSFDDESTFYFPVQYCATLRSFSL